MSNIFELSTCNIAQILGESNRFIFHVFLIHITTCIIDGKNDFLSEELFRSLIITALAMVLYHVFFRKIVEPEINKMKLICYDKKKRIKKKMKSKMKKRSKISKLINKKKKRKKNERS